ncbi:hypothetical protein M0802_011239 [Mischocyttarus mexicanus]|nr:hypothetical protein M0802_011239 [Mischocyttarus mexicanus]
MGHVMVVVILVVVVVVVVVIVNSGSKILVVVVVGSWWPSSTEEEYDEYGDREYRAAEQLGKQVAGENCHALYPECRRSVLDVFSTVLRVV